MKTFILGSLLLVALVGTSFADGLRTWEATVRVKTNGGMGSGVLIGESETTGLVITNNHVIHGETGCHVIFIDGFDSAATVVATDPVWDIAALAIHKPKVKPAVLSETIPKAGDSFTICGYGGRASKGRQSSARCVGFSAPRENMPGNWFRVATAARSGDSGGPIINQKGEVAGLLWGTDGQETMGVCCHQIRYFLTQRFPRFAQGGGSCGPGGCSPGGGGGMPVGQPQYGGGGTAVIDAPPPTSPNEPPLAPVQPVTPKVIAGPQGEPGPKGDPGAPATADQIAAAVVAYMQANPAPKGDKGDTGPAGSFSQEQVDAIAKQAADSAVAAIKKIPFDAEFVDLAGKVTPTKVYLGGVDPAGEPNKLRIELYDEGPIPVTPSSAVAGK